MKLYLAPVAVIVIALTASVWRAPEPQTNATPAQASMRQASGSPTVAARSQDATRYTYIVQTHQAPWTALPEAAITFNGRAQVESAGTKTTKTSEVVVDPAERTRKALAFLQAKSTQARSDWQRYSKILGRSIVPTRQFALALNGAVVQLTASEARTLALQPEIMNVTREQRYELATDSTPTWVGAAEVWAGRTGIATEGKGVTIGIIDSGVLPELSAMTPASTDAADYPAVTKLGLCVSSGACNNKLYGMYDFTIGGNFAEVDDGRDRINHGASVAEVAAGRKRSVSTRVLSGIAPKAKLISYKVCEAGTGCPSGALFSALDQALLDNVQVINISISGADVSPWKDPVTRALLNVRKAGIVPVAAAGNSGPGAATVGYPGSSPWVLSVGATTGTRVGNSYSHDATLADVLWSGSSRGPSLVTTAVGKPDMSAPGVSILWQGATSMWLGTGTSLASPHAAGAAALLRSANPTWSVDRIVSSLSTGVSTSVRRDDGLAATGFETGGGRLNVVNASKQGLFLAINDLDGQQSFDKADPGLGGNPRLLNLANIVHENCQGTCTVLRRFTDGAGGGSWKAVVEGPTDVPVVVSPSTFTLTNGQSQPVSINVTSKDAAAFLPGWVFGRIRMVRTDIVAPDVVLPWSVNLTDAYKAPAVLSPMQLSPGVPTSVELASTQMVKMFADYKQGGKPVRITVVSQAQGSAELQRGPIGASVASTSSTQTVKTVAMAPPVASVFELTKEGRYIVNITNTSTAAQTVVVSIETYDTISLPQEPKD